MLQTITKSPKNQLQQQVAQDIRFMGQFPNPLISEETSCKFVKRLMALAISSIIYMRNLFDEKDFIEKELDGVKVKIIKGSRSTSKQAQNLAKWLEGAFDAIERKYLRVLLLEIVEPKTSKVLECYHFKFIYEDKQTTCTLENQSGEKMSGFADSSLDSIANAVKHLMRNIFLISSLHEPLPSNCSFCVKLMYHEDVTPPEYEPPGFKACDEPIPEVNAPPFRLGSVTSPHHVICISSKQQPKPSSPPLVQSEHPRIPLDQEVPSVLNTPKEKTNAAPQIGQVSIKNDGTVVNCACMLEDHNDVVMLCCKLCGTYQHGGCYKVIANDNRHIRAEHTCVQCNEDISESQKKMDKDLCLFQRAIIFCSSSPSVSLQKLSNEFKLDLPAAAVLMRRLQKEEAVYKSTMPVSVDKPEFIFGVNKFKINEKIFPKYFGTEKKLDGKEKIKPNYGKHGKI